MDKEEMRFRAALQFLIHSYTYPNKELAIAESIQMADKLINALEKTKEEKNEVQSNIDNQ
jgi:hypothetical protein